jgi:hypothetical protein
MARWRAAFQWRPAARRQPGLGDRGGTPARPSPGCQFVPINMTQYGSSSLAKARPRPIWCSRQSRMFARCSGLCIRPSTTSDTLACPRAMFTPYRDHRSPGVLHPLPGTVAVG